MNRQSQRGVALVVTLVMLSMVTFMAVVFLGISRRERASVKVAEDQTLSRLMADTALARAQAGIVGGMLSTSNLLNYDFAVSTNFVSPRGFEPGRGTNTDNVGYTYGNGNLLNEDDFLVNMGNLFYDARPPVYVQVPLANGRISNDFRFYLDFNRNGRFETNGVQALIDRTGRYIQASGGVGQSVLTNFLVGDPEWIGVLERPDRPHSPTNRFVGRYAYLVLPEGKSLDLNFIHNRVSEPRGGQTLNPGYRRSQGIGSWELNLGAFFKELNTNSWSDIIGSVGYSYSITPTATIPARGTSFEDARAVLDYRYAGNGNTLWSVQQLYGTWGSDAFRAQKIDGYSDGGTVDDPLLPWAGSPNTNAFTDVQQLFTLKDSGPQFSNLTRRLTLPAVVSATNQASYDRYTYYRLLSQLGTDSKSSLGRKMHLNWSDTGYELFTNGTAFSATNFMPWTPVSFLTNAADRLLRTEYTFGIGGIPVYPSNYYTAQLHRLLQVAANLYDATTNRTANGFPNDLPTVFRPVFAVSVTNGVGGATNVSIVGFREVQSTADASGPWVDMQQNPLAVVSNANVFGIPYVIGAKKGYPNFNEFELRTAVQVGRKLELAKRVVSGPVVSTNQMLLIGISNLFGVEAWNSYGQSYTRPLRLLVTNTFSMVLSNQFGVVARRDLLIANNLNIPAGGWTSNQFRLPLSTNISVVPNAIYRTTPPGRLDPLGTNPQFERFSPSRFSVPQWVMNITNRLTYMVIDQLSNRIVDFVNLKELTTHLDVSEELVGNTGDVSGESSVLGSMWLTNRPGGALSEFVPTFGIINQMQAALGILPLSRTEWTSFNLQPDSGQDKEKSIDLLRTFVGLTPLRFQNDPTYRSSLSQQTGRSLVYQVPFAPVRKLVQRTSWAANDPLVHYTVEDLRDFRQTNDVRFAVPPNLMPTNSNLGLLNLRYRPWQGNPNKTAEPGDVTRQDPLIYGSDDWQFPNSKFGSIGTMGSVHRGTPWQTIYLKSGIHTNEWVLWAGNPNTHPTNDWRLPDLFTVAPNENATRGLLSVNQTGNAAWAAVLAGVNVGGNHTLAVRASSSTTSVSGQTVAAGTGGTIMPASVQLSRIVEGINRTRTNFVGSRYPSLGMVLATPELTVRSPYLNTNADQLQYHISEESYESIPRQILSLLKADEPRVVVYAFGQSLKPAEASIVRVPGPYFQICTNYAITGEVVTKSVVRFDGPVENLKSVVESFNVLPSE